MKPKNQKLVGWACRVWTETDNGWEPTSAVFPTKGHAEEWGAKQVAKELKENELSKTYEVLAEWRFPVADRFGSWVEDENKATIHCSCCNRRLPKEWLNAPYCPHCIANMQPHILIEMEFDIEFSDSFKGYASPGSYTMTFGDKTIRFDFVKTVCFKSGENSRIKHFCVSDPDFEYCPERITKSLAENLSKIDEFNIDLEGVEGDKDIFPVSLKSLCFYFESPDGTIFDEINVSKEILEPVFEENREEEREYEVILKGTSYYKIHIKGTSLDQAMDLALDEDGGDYTEIPYPELTSEMRDAVGYEVIPELSKEIS